MQSVFITKRVSPNGYLAITKTLAVEVYNRGHPITLCGSEVNHLNVFKGQRLGFTFSLEMSRGKPFDFYVQAYMLGLPREYGRTCVYYTLETVAWETFQELTSYYEKSLVVLKGRGKMEDKFW